MRLQKKLKITLLSLLLCLILLISASYAWLVLSLAPEITSVETNLGANGSLEIALLSNKTYTDPISIRAGIGDSAVVQEAPVSNQNWGNVIDLTHESYGLDKISLLPARLNLLEGAMGEYQVASDMIKTAGFGADGRITLLEGESVSAVCEEGDFTFYTASQSYGLRAIGTISNLTPQQIALAGARTSASAQITAASRTVKTAWRESGSAITTLLCQVYAFDKDTLTGEDIAAIRTFAEKLQRPVSHTELCLRQGVIGIAASQIRNEAQFRTVLEALRDPSVPLAQTMLTLDLELPEGYASWIAELGTMQSELRRVTDACDAFNGKVSWKEAEPLLDVLLDADKAFLGDHRLSTRKAFSGMEEYNGIVLQPNSGVLAKLAAYCGNFSAYSAWTGSVTVEARTADPADTPHLLTVAGDLEGRKAAAGGWTRAKLDTVYAYAVDLAFRCNRESDLLLQTQASLRVNESAQEPVTQGGGSYMRFTSGDMSEDRQLALMDTIRVGFVDDRNVLVALAKLDTEHFHREGDGIAASLYLYDFAVDQEGLILVGECLGEDAPILPLSQNTPAVLTAVVWLDGDQVDNSMAGFSAEHSMNGVLNLQFASSADLSAMDIPMKNRK